MERRCEKNEGEGIEKELNGQERRNANPTTNQSPQGTSRQPDSHTNNAAFSPARPCTHRYRDDIINSKPGEREREGGGCGGCPASLSGFSIPFWLSGRPLRFASVPCPRSLPRQLSIRFFSVYGISAYGPFKPTTEDTDAESESGPLLLMHAQIWEFPPFGRGRPGGPAVLFKPTVSLR